MEKKHIYVIYDRNVESFALQLAKKHPALPIIADEEHKTMDTVLDICRWLLAQGANRDAVVWAVGGGVTTDLVGFAASIYKRGVRYANYPTTLLSQVDAGVGGKTGVNLDNYKNMIGVIKFPIYTRILPEVLRTLPERELRSGAAEMLKTFLIDNRGGNYEKAVKLLSESPLDFDALAPLIKAAADVKRKIVEQDPYEENLRRCLNLGHTYAHAIEWYQHTRRTKAPMTHGEAVAVGLVQAALLSERLGVCNMGLADRLRKDLQACGLPTELPCPEDMLESALWKDKKAEKGILHFVLIKRIGKVIIKDLDDLYKPAE
ncbi:MAG: 3-dehydroquinate synthase [Bacteroidales bacterium]|jgi:3-dehydroquinate synthase|nr:3-dehydroquinate synthase [Bacteroidales bacterium]